MKKSLNKRVKEMLVKEYSKEYADARAKSLSPNYKSIQSNIEKGKLQAEKEVNDIANQVQHLLNKGDLDGAEELMKTLYTDNPNNPANVYKNTQYSKENPEGEVVDGEPDSSTNISTTSNGVGVVGNQQEPSQEPSETKPGFMAQAGEWMGKNPEAALALGGAGLVGTHLLTKKREKKKRDESVNENGGPIMAYDMEPGELNNLNKKPEVVITEPEEEEIVITKPEDEPKDDWTTDIPPAGTEERKAHYDKYNKKYDDSIPGYDADGNPIVVPTGDKESGDTGSGDTGSGDKGSSDTDSSVEPETRSLKGDIENFIKNNPEAATALGVGGLGLGAAYLINKKKEKKNKKNEVLSRNIKNLIKEDVRPRSLRQEEINRKLYGYKILSEKSTLKKLAKAALLIGGGALLHKMYQDGAFKDMFSKGKALDATGDTDKANDKESASNNKIGSDTDSSSTVGSTGGMGGGGDPRGPYDATNQFMRKKGWKGKMKENDSRELKKHLGKLKALKNKSQNEGFAGALPASERKAFNTMRKNQSEVLGYKLTGKSDVKVEVDDATQHQQGHRLSEDSDYKKMMGFGSKK